MEILALNQWILYPIRIVSKHTLKIMYAIILGIYGILILNNNKCEILLHVKYLWGSTAYVILITFYALPLGHGQTFITVLPLYRNEVHVLISFFSFFRFRCKSDQVITTFIAADKNVERESGEPCISGGNTFQAIWRFFVRLSSCLYGDKLKF